MAASSLVPCTLASFCSDEPSTRNAADRSNTSDEDDDDEDEDEDEDATDEALLLLLVACNGIVGIADVWLGVVMMMMMMRVG